MERVLFSKKNIAWAILIVVAVAGAGFFFFNLDAVSAAPAAASVIFQVSAGDGFREIAQHLYGDRLIRSPLAFELFSLVDGRAFTLRPGLYRLSPSMDVQQIVAAMSGGDAGEATVVIPEGSTIFDIDRILSNALVTRPGAFASAALGQGLEGKLFPDTYQFYTNDSVAAVIAAMTKDFNAKAAPLLAADPAHAERNLIIASIVQKEVPTQNDQELVAGIILKRMAAGMPLDIDATICYAKLIAAASSNAGSPELNPEPCSLTALDFRAASPYNTYLNRGLPPGPIGNPGTSAITASLHPQSSPFFYYLSDPATGKTIFAKTLDEQNQNRVKYLESN